MRLFLILIVCMIIPLSANAEDTSYRDLRPKELNRMIKEEKPLTIIDVRTPPEWAQTGTIKDAKLITAYSNNYKVDPSFLEQIEKIAPTKDAPLALVCRSGNRSGKAATVLAEMGYTNLFNLRGGMNDWKDFGFVTCQFGNAPDEQLCE